MTRPTSIYAAAIRVLIALIVTAWAVTAAQAQDAGPTAGLECNAHGTMVAMLHDLHRETRVAMAITSNDSLLETFASKGGATWTIVWTQPGGLSCIVAHGTDYNARSVPLDPAL